MMDFQVVLDFRIMGRVAELDRLGAQCWSLAC